MTNLTFKLEEFEGPLDLLLYLIGKNKMDLHDIPILELIEQYTQIIRQVQENQLELASEFIAMAARLVQMKSFLLLPRSEEGERMKQELTGELIEYEACRRMAARLGEMQAGVYHVVRKPMTMETDHTYTRRHDPHILLDALAALGGKKTAAAAPRQERFEPLVAAPFVSVASRVVHILRGMVSGRIRRLSQLFGKKESRSQTVATFLAVLELVRAGRLAIDGDEEDMTLERGRLRTQEGD